MRNSARTPVSLLLIVLVVFGLAGCSRSRHVPSGSVFQIVAVSPDHGAILGGTRVIVTVDASSAVRVGTPSVRFGSQQATFISASTTSTTDRFTLDVVTPANVPGL